MSSIPSDESKDYVPSQTSVKDTDALIAEQSIRVPIVDREKVPSDLHGVPDSLVKETQELVACSKEELDRKIKVPSDDSKDYVPSQTSAQDADALIAEQLSRMSSVDREKALFDLHGVPDSLVKETQELVARSLEEFDCKIKQIKKKDAYDAALLQDPSYVSDRRFRLKFLRTTNFDPTWAAKKFAQFFERKLELFGKDKLTKDITLNDLDHADIECLESGFCTILPLQDGAGRPIICWTQRLIGNASLQSAVRFMN